MFFTVCIFVLPLVLAVVCIINRHTYNRIVRKTVKVISAVSAFVFGVTVIWFAVIIFSMAAKIDRFTFSTFDFMAYGGVKMIFEAVFSAVLCTLNTILFVKLVKNKEQNEK